MVNLGKIELILRKENMNQVVSEKDKKIIFWSGELSERY
jgi:hypothetical protein